MIYTRRSWQEIDHEPGETITNMLIVDTDGETSWSDLKGLFLKIEHIAQEQNVIDCLDVSIKVGLMTVAFHTRDSDVVPDRILRAIDQIAALVAVRE